MAIVWHEKPTILNVTQISRILRWKEADEVKDITDRKRAIKRVLDELKKKGFCVWEYIESDGFYNRSCGSGFEVSGYNDNLKVNQIFFCPKCGKRIKEKRG